MTIKTKTNKKFMRTLPIKRINDKSNFIEGLKLDNPICTIEVNENIRRVKLGQPLTRPLRILNRSCDFRKKYEDILEFADPKLKEEKLAKSREYCKKYFKRSGVRAKQRERMKEYYKRPEQRVKQRERMRKKFNIKPENYRV